MLPQKKITFDSFIRGVLSGAVIIAILYLLNRLSGVLLPFFIAWLIAYLTYPLGCILSEPAPPAKPRAFYSGCHADPGSIGRHCILLFVPPMIEECAKLKELIEIYLIEDRNHAAIPETVSEFIRKNIDFNWLQNNITTDNIVSAIQKLLPKVWTLLSTSYNIILAIFTLFIIILYLFFILLDYEQIANGWITLLPKSIRDGASSHHGHQDQHEPLFPRTGTRGILRGYPVQHRIPYYRFSPGYRTGTVHRPAEHGSLSADHRIYSHHPAGLIESCRYRRSFWWTLGLALVVFAVVQAYRT